MLRSGRRGTGEGQRTLWCACAWDVQLGTPFHGSGGLSLLRSASVPIPTAHRRCERSPRAAPPCPAPQGACTRDSPPWRPPHSSLQSVGAWRCVRRRPCAPFPRPPARGQPPVHAARMAHACSAMPDGSAPASMHAHPAAHRRSPPPAHPRVLQPLNPWSNGCGSGGGPGGCGHLPPPVPR